MPAGRAGTPACSTRPTRRRSPTGSRPRGTTRRASRSTRSSRTRPTPSPTCTCTRPVPRRPRGTGRTSACRATWTATIDNSALGGVSLGDVVRYFVVAQDTVGHLTASPSAGFAGSDVNNVTTPPTTPNAYAIVPAFAGAYSVGTGQTYTSLTLAGG